jgi:CMP-N,N'-diacetyllegionaminic acid synthase
MSKEILGIIPARSGSKGVERKNVRDVAGKPLIQYTIEEAIESERLSDFLVSTDSEEFAEIARDAGAPVPFLRPAELATDEASSLGVIQHAVREYERQNETRVDIAVLLQPTTPMRDATDIDRALELFLDSDDESLLTYYEAKDAHPNQLYRRVTGHRLRAIRDQHENPRRRQEYEPVYVVNGAVYLSTRELLFDEEKIYTNTPLGLEMPRERSVNIDEPFDLEIAELLIENRRSG